MNATRECRDIASIRKEFDVPRFLWELTKRYNATKKNATELSLFWVSQDERLRRYDEEKPGRFVSTGAPLGPAPRLPSAPLAHIVASGSKPKNRSPPPAPKSKEVSTTRQSPPRQSPISQPPWFSPLSQPPPATPISCHGEIQTNIRKTTETSPCDGRSRCRRKRRR